LRPIVGRLGSKLEEVLLPFSLFDLLLLIGVTQIENLVHLLALDHQLLRGLDLMDLLKPLLLVLELQVAIGPVALRRRHLLRVIGLVCLDQLRLARVLLEGLLGIFNRLWFE